MLRIIDAFMLISEWVWLMVGFLSDYDELTEWAITGTEMKREGIGKAGSKGDGKDDRVDSLFGDGVRWDGR